MTEHRKSKEKDKFNDDGLLFLNESGYSMHFILLMSDSSERDKLKRRIENRMGCVHTNVEDVGPYSLILTDHENMKWKHDKIERFQIGFIADCFNKKKIVDLNKYGWETSNIYRRNFEYLKVVFERVYTWDTIPEEFIISSLRSNDIEVDSDTDSDDSFLDTNYGISSRLKTDSEKHTRDPYSRSEKEAIVKYIVDLRAYHRVKGREFWQDLERQNVCPKRTWQSMKEHAIKKIPREMSTFKFLTPKQREKLSKALTQPKDR